MTGRTLEEVMDQLPAARRKRVEQHAAQLIAEERSLRDLRTAHQLTQQSMARKLGVKQHSISRLEQRSDMLLSTLADYVRKLGGELVITAEFPDRKPVRLKGIGGLAAESRVSQEGRVARRSLGDGSSIRVDRARRVRAKRSK